MPTKPNSASTKFFAPFLNACTSSPMTWNYRIAKSSWPAIKINEKLTSPKGHEFVIVEAYYSDKGKLNGWTQKEIAPSGDTIEDLIKCLQRMLKDAKKYRKAKALNIRWTV